MRAIDAISWALLALLGPACGEDATLTRVQTEVFALSCNFSACHGGPTTQSALDLSGATHGRLVGVASREKAGALLVSAGQPDVSFLVDKLEARALPTAPPGERWDPMPPPSGGLDAERIALIRAWIEGGALDD